jgi:hypothetical protein
VYDRAAPGTTLVATRRDALQAMDAELGRMREGIDEIDTQAARLWERLAALGALRQMAKLPISAPASVSQGVHAPPYHPCRLLECCC